MVYATDRRGMPDLTPGESDALMAKLTAFPRLRHLYIARRIGDRPGDGHDRGPGGTGDADDVGSEGHRMPVSRRRGASGTSRSSRSAMRDWGTTPWYTWLPWFGWNTWRWGATRSRTPGWLT